MKKIVLLIAVISLIGMFALSTPSQAAGTFLGTFCWNVDGFADVIKVDVFETGGGTYLLNGALFTGSYMKGGAGNASLWSADGKVHISMGLHAQVSTGLSSWMVHATLTPGVLSGPIDFLWLPSGAITTYSVSKVSCAGIGEMSGPAIDGGQ
jgi:hypothetical protein